MNCSNMSWRVRRTLPQPHRYGQHLTRHPAKPKQLVELQTTTSSSSSSSSSSMAMSAKIGQHTVILGANSNSQCKSCWCVVQTCWPQ